MAAFAQEMELLSRQLSQAHRAAIQAELLAAGLEEVNHPMLVSLWHNPFSSAPRRTRRTPARPSGIWHNSCMCPPPPSPTP